MRAPSLWVIPTDGIAIAVSTPRHGRHPLRHVVRDDDGNGAGGLCIPDLEDERAVPAVYECDVAGDRGGVHEGIAGRGVSIAAVRETTSPATPVVSRAGPNDAPWVSTEPSIAGGESITSTAGCRP